jgi:hypothetical protein
MGCHVDNHSEVKRRCRKRGPTSVVLRADEHSCCDSKDCARIKAGGGVHIAVRGSVHAGAWWCVCIRSRRDPRWDLGEFHAELRCSRLNGELASVASKVGAISQELTCKQPQANIRNSGWHGYHVRAHYAGVLPCTHTTMHAHYHARTLPCMHAHYHARTLPSTAAEDTMMHAHYHARTLPWMHAHYHALLVLLLVHLQTTQSQHWKWWRVSPQEGIRCTCNVCQVAPLGTEPTSEAWPESLVARVS